MSDELDQAEELIEMQTEMAINRVRERMADQAVDVTECEECGEPIPEQRRLSVPSTRLCAECQTDIELQQRQQRGWW